jgi:serine/threonine protein kinase
METAPEPEPEAAETVIDGWRLHDRMAASGSVRERFVAVHQTDGQRGVLTLYAAGSEPDRAIYDLLRRLPRDHVPEIIATGRWCDRAYEVLEEFPGGTLADLPSSADDQTLIAALVRELGLAVHSLAEAGLRHRDLRPSAVFVRSRDPLDLVIGGFGSARLSEFDLDIASPLETTRYMAPEAIAGGVAPASDWWSLGIILLERITNGACFEGINEQAFLIHVLTNGVPLPETLDPSMDLLLRVFSRAIVGNAGSGRRFRRGWPGKPSPRRKVQSSMMPKAERPSRWAGSSTGRPPPSLWPRLKRQIGKRQRIFCCGAPLRLGLPRLDSKQRYQPRCASSSGSKS